LQPAWPLTYRRSQPGRLQRTHRPAVATWCPRWASGVALRRNAIGHANSRLRADVTSPTSALRRRVRHLRQATCL